eukprot:scaffold194744_cov30-Tisochrysis_lutea.AAC.2
MPPGPLGVHQLAETHRPIPSSRSTMACRADARHTSCWVAPTRLVVPPIAYTSTHARRVERTRTRNAFATT